MGAERLRSAELVARDVEAWRANSTDVVRITRELCLPVSNTARTGHTHGQDCDRRPAFEPSKREAAEYFLARRLKPAVSRLECCDLGHLRITAFDGHASNFGTTFAAIAAPHRV